MELDRPDGEKALWSNLIHLRALLDFAIMEYTSFAIATRIKRGNDMNRLFSRLIQMVGFFLSTFSLL